MKKDNLSVIGIGRLGLCFCLTLEKGGYNVVGCDIVQAYVDKINNKTFLSYEPGVNELLKNSADFIVTTDLVKLISHSSMIFVTVATYSEEDGRYDVTQVDAVINSLIELGKQDNKKHLIICSNVNPGYTDSVHSLLKDLNWDVSYNPETIAQGTILKNQREPDCVYIGSSSPNLAITIARVYERMCLNNPKIHEMDRISAELTKLSMNCFLTCKISFANMVGDLALKIGANPKSVLSAIGADSRINNKFFSYGFGWGGPCFPRDTRAFIRLAKNNGMAYDMCDASNSINEKHLKKQIENFLMSGETAYYTDSVTYKKGTTIIEESQQLEFALGLARAGIKVVIKEHPKVIEELKEAYGDLFIYED